MNLIVSYKHLSLMKNTAFFYMHLVPFSHYSTTFGINRMSILKDVLGLSVVTGLAHDIMHDMCEGVVKLALNIVLIKITALLLH